MRSLLVSTVFGVADDPYTGFQFYIILFYRCLLHLLYPCTQSRPQSQWGWHQQPLISTSPTSPILLQPHSSRMALWPFTSAIYHRGCFREQGQGWGVHHRDPSPFCHHSEYTVLCVERSILTVQNTAAITSYYVWQHSCLQHICQRLLSSLGWHEWGFGDTSLFWSFGVVGARVLGVGWGARCVTSVVYCYTFNSPVLSSGLTRTSHRSKGQEDKNFLPCSYHPSSPLPLSCLDSSLGQAVPSNSKVATHWACLCFEWITLFPPTP